MDELTLLSPIKRKEIKMENEIPLKYKIPTLLDAKDSDCERMNLKVSEALIQGVLVDMKKDNEFTEEFSKLHWLLEVLRTRMHYYGGSVTLGVAAFLLMQCRGNVGNMVMWAYALSKLSKQLDKTISTQELADKFPLGFPTKEFENETWNAQKGFKFGVKTDNLIDNPQLLEY